MRTTIATTLLGLMLLTAGAWSAGAAGTPPEPEAKAKESPATPASGVLNVRLVPEQKPAAAQSDEDFVPPDGWLPKKRGKYTVYCRKDYNVRGTRFPAETCYDKTSIREMVMQENIDRERYDQLRRTCATATNCGTH